VRWRNTVLVEKEPRTGAPHGMLAVLTKEEGEDGDKLRATKPVHDWNTNRHEFTNYPTHPFFLFTTNILGKRDGPRQKQKSQLPINVLYIVMVRCRNAGSATKKTSRRAKS
jgi:hypothetical protein